METCLLLLSFYRASASQRGSAVAPASCPAMRGESESPSIHGCQKLSIGTLKLPWIKKPKLR